MKRRPSVNLADSPRAGKGAAQDRREAGGGVADLRPPGESPRAEERSRAEPLRDEVALAEVWGGHPLGEDRDAGAGPREVDDGLGERQPLELEARS